MPGVFSLTGFNIILPTFIWFKTSNYRKNLEINLPHTKKLALSSKS
jgi:hypothetical protein